MLIEILSFSSNNKDLLKLALNLRYNVFTLEQNVDKDIDFDGKDFEATHYMIKVDGNPAATARWRETDFGIKIERMAVSKEFRNLGLGHLLMKFIINDVLPSRRIIYLHAQRPVIEFYKQLGFTEDGDFFKEANIDHKKMIYKK
jgi:predicted GNAT family N-acyltransferase